MAERIEPVLAQGVPSVHLTTLCYEEIWVASKDECIFVWNISQTLNLEKFHHGTSTAANVVSLVRPTTVVSLSH